MLCEAYTAIPCYKKSLNLHRNDLQSCKRKGNASPTSRLTLMSRGETTLWNAEFLGGGEGDSGTEEGTSLGGAGGLDTGTGGLDTGTAVGEGVGTGAAVGAGVGAGAGGTGESRRESRSRFRCSHRRRYRNWSGWRICLMLFTIVELDGCSPAGVVTSRLPPFVLVIFTNPRMPAGRPVA
ncbi:hypothetical protein O6H91_12G021400 [Diphasiastrum complanatum]|uniref:Uncharacterized protein n=1 Tax=Diphasiastrum complanatum TaxID=34168 RepID=A0ACC2BZQ6_DIPCM|nr:hypothetical protein O6H91_12G021400 [Diphasiastrum complanatum]